MLSLSRSKRLFLWIVLVVSLVYNFIFRIFLEEGFLSSSASLIVGLLAAVTLIPTASRLIDIRNPDPKEVRVGLSLVFHVNLLLSFGAFLVCFISFICYSIICGIVKSNKNEYVSACLWYLIGLIVTAILVLSTHKEKIPSLAPGWQDKVETLWMKQVLYYSKLAAVSLAYTFFCFTIFDSCFRANGFVQYYGKAEMQQVKDTYLQFDCFCQGGIQEKFQTCLASQRALDNSTDRVMILEHGLSSNSFIERSLVRYISQSMRNYTVCAYNRRMHGWSDSLSYTTLQGFPDVSTNVDYLASWIQSQSLKTPIVYAGHSYGGYHVAYMALNYPSLVKSLVFVDGAYLNNDPSLSGGMGVFPPSTIPMLNGLGLFTGLPMVILSSLSSNQLFELVAPYVQTEYGIQDGLYCDISTDYREMLASLLSLNFVQVAVKDDFMGFANSQAQVLGKLNKLAMTNKSLDIPSLWIAREPKNEVFEPRFFSNMTFVQINDTTQVGMITRQWKETGDLIVGWITNSTAPLNGTASVGAGNGTTITSIKNGTTSTIAATTAITTASPLP